MVLELVQFGMHGGPNHLHVDTNHMYIYRNVDTVQMQNAHDDIPTVAMLDRDDSAPPPLYSLASKDSKGLAARPARMAGVPSTQ